MREASTLVELGIVSQVNYVTCDSPLTSCKTAGDVFPMHIACG